MTDLYKYQVYCTSDAQHEYLWLESTDPEPTTCPVNTAHGIDPQFTSIIDQNLSNDIHIQEESTPTGGHFKVITKAFTAAPSDTTIFTFNWPIPVSVLDATVQVPNNAQDDCLQVDIGPNTIIGTLTQSAAASDTVLDVSSTVMSNIALGFYVDLLNASDVYTNQELGQVINVNTAADQITVQHATSNAFPVTAPTYVRMSVRGIEDFVFGQATMYELGKSKIGGSYVPANTDIRICYTNKTGDAKKFYYDVRYLY